MLLTGVTFYNHVLVDAGPNLNLTVFRCLIIPPEYWEVQAGHRIIRAVGRVGGGGVLIFPIGLEKPATKATLSSTIRLAGERMGTATQGETGKKSN